MKIRLGLLGFIGLGVSVSLLTSVPDTMAASSNKYFCAVLGGIPRTFSRTPRGDIVIINWVNSLGTRTPRERCIEVSQRFQRFYDHGILRKITIGKVNDQNVLCAVPDEKSSCSRHNVLVTLPPNQDPNEASQKLLDVRGWASGSVVELSGGETVETYVNGRSYYNLDTIEKIAPPVTEPVTILEGN